VNAFGSIRLFGSASLLTVLAALWLFGSAGSAMAQQPAGRPLTDPATTTGETSNGLRIDRRVEALTATGYQTAIAAGLVGGVVLAGMAVGTHAAVLAGTAVLVGYVFLPWE
jgi:hypothetical protein